MLGDLSIGSALIASALGDRWQVGGGLDASVSRCELKSQVIIIKYFVEGVLVLSTCRLLLGRGGFLTPELVHAPKSVRMIHFKLVPSVEIMAVSLAVIVEIQLMVQFARSKPAKLQLQILEALNQLRNSEAMLLDVEDRVPQFT